MPYLSAWRCQSEPVFALQNLHVLFSTVLPYILEQKTHLCPLQALYLELLVLNAGCPFDVWVLMRVSMAASFLCLVCCGRMLSVLPEQQLLGNMGIS